MHRISHPRTLSIRIHDYEPGGDPFIFCADEAHTKIPLARCERCPHFGGIEHEERFKNTVVRCEPDPRTQKGGDEAVKVIHVLNDHFASVTLHPRGPEEEIAVAIWPGFDMRCAPLTDCQARQLMDAVIAKARHWKGWSIDDQRKSAS